MTGSRMEIYLRIIQLRFRHTTSRSGKKIENSEEAVAKKETERKVKKSDAWFDYTHSEHFPEAGSKKIAIRSMYRKYLDANKKNVECDSGAPVWWEIREDEKKLNEACVLIKKKKALRGEGQDCKVVGHPCADEWKAICKAPGKYVFVNEEGRFLKPDKDGSVSMSALDIEDGVACKPFIFDVKIK